MATKNAQIVKAAAITIPTAPPNAQTFSFMAHLFIGRAQVNSNLNLSCNSK
jgi:hypothetical protein